VAVLAVTEFCRSKNCRASSTVLCSAKGRERALAGASPMRRGKRGGRMGQCYTRPRPSYWPPPPTQSRKSPIHRAIIHAVNHQTKSPKQTPTSREFAHSLCANSRINFSAPSRRSQDLGLRFTRSGRVCAVGSVNASGHGKLKLAGCRSSNAARRFAMFV
jgi:hypothetical protein